MSDDNDAGPPPDLPDSVPDAPSTPYAWRLTFEYEGEEVRLVARQRVAMLAPVDDAELLDRGQDGFWLELRDEADGSVYRQVLHEPVQTHYEVFSPDPAELPHHVTAPQVRGVFQAVVPDLADGRSIALHGPARRAPAPGGAARTAARPGAAKGRKGAKPPPEPRTLLVAPLREEGDDDGRG
ncbi:hypothetical protein [Cellulomonas sp. KRMCY2]|uniref:hypothetical protein n=1 Tax=Cellulomonas sp. KRMCY2 TaxID=1304865 RepID=UPI00045EB4D6|nr:hypothetical protein [Cellulomonas sp. KRMCY2]